MLYGGDDIGAVVFDVGHYSLRVGYAQEDSPKAEIPAFVGTLEEAAPVPTSVKSDNNETDNFTNTCVTPKKKYCIDTNYLHVARKGMEVTSYMKDGMIDDWDLFEKVLDYAYSKCIQSQSEFHPVLMTEPPLNLRTKRESLAEILFEKYDVPAFSLVKNAVLAAFANGRATGIVIDSGATHTSAVPIQDGFVLSQAVVKSPLGGDYITMLCKNFLQKESNIEIVPSYLIGTKEAVKEGEKARWTRKKNVPEVTNSWHNYMTKKVLQDFQASVLQICDIPYDEKIVSSIPNVHYEFPNGYHVDFGSERFLIPEVLFDPRARPLRTGPIINAALGIGSIVTSSVGMCDVDVRPSLYSSVIVTGGNSFLQGFPERLYRDLCIRIPSSMRLKMISANGSSERRFGAWIGGSILASIGTFQQTWMSSLEYKEGGKSQVERKFP